MRTALGFDGVSSYTGVASNLIFNLQEIVVSLWFEANDLAKTKALIGKDITGSYNWQFYRNDFWTVSQLGWLFYYSKTDSTVGCVLPSAYFNVSQWYNTIFLVKPNGCYEMWVNGTRVAYGTAASFSALRISTTWIRLGGTYGYYAGLIDDVRIYNRALSPSEVSLLYKGFNPITISPGGLWSGNTYTAIYTVRAN